jgi:hypothetical protein
MFRRGTGWTRSCLLTAVLVAALFSSDARSDCPLELTAFLRYSKPTCGLDRLVSRDAQIIIVGNDKVGQAPIVSQIPFYPAQILSYPEFAPASEYPDRKYDEGDGHQTALPAGSSNEFDDTESPFLGIDDLREVRKTSVLFGDPNDPSPIGIEGCTLIYDSVREEKPILPPARDPLALSSDWEYPEILDEAHALRDQSRLFGGPGLQEFYGTPGYSR